MLLYMQNIKSYSREVNIKIFLSKTQVSFKYTSQPALKSLIELI